MGKKPASYWILTIFMRLNPPITAAQPLGLPSVVHTAVILYFPKLPDTAIYFVPVFYFNGDILYLHRMNA